MIERDTQGFDGSTVCVAKQYDGFGRVLTQTNPDDSVTSKLREITTTVH